MDLQYLFNQGVSDYWAGHLPEGWDNHNIRAGSPYLTGWYMASMLEVNHDFLDDRNR